MKRIELLQAMGSRAVDLFGFEDGVTVGRSKTPPKNLHARPPLFVPGLRRVPFHDPATFPWTAELERHWRTIREEAVAARTARRERFRQYDDEGLDDVAGWNALQLNYHDARNETNAALCPVTAELMDRVPRRMGVNFVSWMAPGAHIRPHCGPSNLWLTYHLALVVPDVEACAIRVADQTRHWHEGESVVLDDSYWHEAWNRSADDRLVLLLQFWHPDLDDEEVAYLSELGRGVMQLPAFERARARKLA